MLGPPKLRHLDEPVTVSLEALIPPDHFYRHLDETLDLGFVREWTRELYSERGRPSIDPVVFFKLQLVMFFEGLRSERKLVETASLNLAHRWYLGYALDEPLPDHSSLTRIRQRLGTNAPGEMADSHRVYMDLAQVGKGNTYIGAEVVLRWYERNMMMFVNVSRLATHPEDRVLVVVDGGHLPLLRHFLTSSGRFQTDDIGTYLS